LKKLLKPKNSSVSNLNAFRTNSFIVALFVFPSDPEIRARCPLQQMLAVADLVLNLIAFFPQNEVPILLSSLYYVDDVTITTKVSKSNEVTNSL